MPQPSSQFLLSHFDRLAEAPGGLAKLQALILQLAVTGKLLPQNKTDEPAAKLLDQIHTDKSRLIREGKIKMQELQPPIGDGEIESELPQNWAPTRIGDLLTVIRGASPRPKGDPKYFSVERTNYHWIKISDIRKHSKDGVLYDTDEFLTEAGMEKSVLLPKGSLVVTNSATIGVPIILGFDGGCIHDGYLAFPYFPETTLSKEYFFILFQTLKAYAVKKARGMAQLNLNTDLVRSFPLHLPPLAEQRRIVAKVEELMGLCDALEAAQRERETVRTRLRTSALHRLTAPDPDPKSAAFVFQNLFRLASEREDIDDFRQSVLQFAIEGKLSSDGSEARGDLLLQNLRKQKHALITSGKVPKEKPADSIDSSDVPFEIPPSWTWSRVAWIATALDYGTSEKSERTASGVPVVSMGNIQGSKVLLENLKRVPDSIDGLPDLYLESGDILFNRTNSAELVGKTGLFNGAPRAFTFASYLIRLRLLEEFADPRFVILATNAPYFRPTQIVPELVQQCGQANVNGTKLANFLIPLPPLAEQRRIVAKVDELMAVLDALEATLTTARATAESLFAATIANIGETHG